MDKEVLIHVRGLQTIDADGDQEPVEIVVPGEYYFRNGSHYLRYEEVMEDFAEPTINYIKIYRRVWKSVRKAWLMFIWFLNREKRI